MSRIWSRPVSVRDPDGPDYWDYFSDKRIEQAGIFPGALLLDIGCGTGSSLFPAAEKIGPHGFAVGIDICPG